MYLVESTQTTSSVDEFHKLDEFCYCAILSHGYATIIKGFIYKLSNKYILGNIPSQFVGNREIGCYLFDVMLEPVTFR